jgi:hypothetical protein
VKEESFPLSRRDYYAKGIEAKLHNGLILVDEYSENMISTPKS